MKPTSPEGMPSPKFKHNSPSFGHALVHPKLNDGQRHANLHRLMFLNSGFQTLDAELGNVPILWMCHLRVHTD
jgi:hypothetical protein